jgi:hypothetical protein
MYRRRRIMGDSPRRRMLAARHADSASVGGNTTITWRLEAQRE